MNTASVWVPATLLLDPQLPPSAKLLWLVLFRHSRSGPVRPALLQARSTLAQATLLGGLRRLEVAGWCRIASGNLATATNRDIPGPRVAVPTALLADPRVGIRGKVLYGVLQRSTWLCWRICPATRTRPIRHLWKRLRCGLHGQKSVKAGRFSQNPKSASGTSTGGS